MKKGDWLDAGVSMAKVEDCPSQVEYLVNTLKTTYAGKVDFQTDWKLLTLFIGANNICGMKGLPLSPPENLQALANMLVHLIPNILHRIWYFAIER